MASAINNSARAVSRSSNSRAEVANLLCFFAAVICRNGNDVGKGLLLTGLNAREGTRALGPGLTGGEGVARGDPRGDPRGELRSLNAEPAGVGSPATAAPKTGMKGLIPDRFPSEFTGVIDADETRR